VQLGLRIREYVDHRKLSKVLVIAHGGEPLLHGPEGIDEFFGTLRASTADIRRVVSFGMQTNGTLVTPAVVDALRRHGVVAGVSLDGPPEFNDIFRVTKRGEGSSPAVMAGVELLRADTAGSSVFGGFLSVANPDIPPRQAFDHFESVRSPAVDFLLPDFNHDTYPRERWPIGTFGSWFSELFDIWIESNSRMDVRTFGCLMRLLLGGTYGYDALGPRSRGLLVVETDGSYHAVDSLKSAYDGVTSTGLSVWNAPIAAVEGHPKVLALSDKASAAARVCLDCQHWSVCGGGYLPHRYSAATGFDRESVYCEDLQILISHVSAYLRAQGLYASSTGQNLVEASIDYPD